MSDTSELGVLYTEHSPLRARTHITSLWSYEARSRERNRASVALSSDGNQEYWLERWDSPSEHDSRLQFSRRFCAAAGLPPKLSARITRFNSLVYALLSTDVSRWASLPAALGYYDQAHMINEFRAFTGTPPTVFFRPHDEVIDPARIQLRGRPSEWLRPAGTQATSVGVSGH